MIQFGQEVRDVIHGFTGIVTGRVSYITGCDQVLVQPPMRKDGNVPEARWIDVDRVEVTNRKPVKLASATSRGPDAPAPIK